MFHFWFDSSLSSDLPTFETTHCHNGHWMVCTNLHRNCRRLHVCVLWQVGPLHSWCGRHVLKRRKVGGRGNHSRLYIKENYPPFSTINNTGRKKSTKMLVWIRLVVPTQTQPWACLLGQPGYPVLTYQQSHNLSSTDTDRVGNSYVSADFLAREEGVCGKRRLLWTSHLSTGGLPFRLKDFSKKSLPSKKVNVLWCSYLCCEG